MISSFNPAVPFSPRAELSLQQTHFAATKAIKAFEQNDAAEVTASLKTLGEQALAERGSDPIAMKSLVFLAAHGKELGEEASKTLETVCAKAFGAPPPDKTALDRIQSAGGHALDAFKAISAYDKNDAAARAAAQKRVSDMPVYLLQIAGQQALENKEMTIADEIGKALNDRLSPDQTQPHHWLTQRDAALEQLREVTGKTYGNMKPGLVVELPATPMTPEERNSKLFDGMAKGDQRPVSFKLGPDFVHGFLHVDAKGKQHICVLNSHADQPKFMENFMKALGLPESACKSVALNIGHGQRGLSEATLAHWLFTYCANNGGGTTESIEKFAKHAVKNRSTIDFLQASRTATVPKTRVQSSGADMPVPQGTQVADRNDAKKRRADAKAVHEAPQMHLPSRKAVEGKQEMARKPIPRAVVADPGAESSVQSPKDEVLVKQEVKSQAAEPRNEHEDDHISVIDSAHASLIIEDSVQDPGCFGLCS